MNTHKGTIVPIHREGLRTVLEQQSLIEDSPRLVACMVRRGLIRFVPSSAMPANVKLHLLEMESGNANTIKA